jgi:hypothetical protein
MLELYLLDVLDALFWLFLCDGLLVGVAGLWFWVVGVFIGVGREIDGVIGFECEVLFILRGDVFFSEKFSGFESIDRLNNKWQIIVDKLLTAQISIDEIIADSFSRFADEQSNILYILSTSDIILTDIISRFFLFLLLIHHKIHVIFSILF